jgi:hypothetical protein
MRTVKATDQSVLKEFTIRDINKFVSSPTLIKVKPFPTDSVSRLHTNSLIKEKLSSESQDKLARIFYQSKQNFIKRRHWTS